jgi:acetyltransferase-like isoleucine patch superfamily enzyme
MTIVASRSERRDGRRLRHAVARDCLAPPHRLWGAFGRSQILAPTRVTRPDCIFVGDDVTIMENVFLSVVGAFPDIEPRLVLEDGVTVGRGAGFAVVGEVVVGRRASIGAFSLIADTYHPYEALDRLPAVVRPLPVHIGAGAILGSHVVVLPGVTIGAGAYVEHHSVVGRDVPPGGVVADYFARVRDEG